MSELQREWNPTEFRSLVSSAERFLETCEGSDIGSPESRTTWVFGIEPGWSVRDQARLNADIEASREQSDIHSVETQLESPYNRNAFKLLCAMDGGAPENYLEFAKRVRPFERGSRGYFKGNLFPIPVNKLITWDEEARRDTGFESKAEYQSWVRKVRLPLLSSKVEQHRPRVLIGTGIGSLEDFRNVARATEVQEHTFTVNGHKKRMFVATDGLVPLVVLPHISGSHWGLNSNESIAKAAKVIVDYALATA